ncbi:MAG TPA: PspC domain-containing protein [Acidimicrobiia bacterium]|nr:PspC domain-containing protein [Acidimicrobiia bacterium]
MNDTTQTEPGDGSRQSAGPLYRPAAGRIISGTALGLAQKLGLPPLLVRAGFVLLVFSGIGIPLYIVSWLLIPAEGETESVGQRWLQKMSGSQAWLGVVLVVVAVAILASALPFMDGGIVIPTVLLVLGILLYRGEFRRPAGPPTPPANFSSPPPTSGIAPAPAAPRRPSNPPSPLGQITIGLTIISLGALALIDRVSPLVDAGPRHYLALAITVIGLGVLVGTRYGRARWLIPFGLILIPVSIVAGVAEIDETASTRLIHPTSFAELQGSYELSTGRLTIDLSDLPWEGEVVELNASVGVGSLDVLLPPGVGIEADTEVGIGESRGPENSEGGLGVDYAYAYPDRGGGLLITHLEVGIGEASVAGLALEPSGNFVEGSGDIVIAATDRSALAEGYSVVGDANIVIDLSRIDTGDDLFLDLAAEDGMITVVLPEGVSYNVNATSSNGFIDVLGTTSEPGGTVTSQADIGRSRIHINAVTDEGDILITMDGERS